MCIWEKIDFANTPLWKRRGEGGGEGRKEKGKEMRGKRGRWDEGREEKGGWNEMLIFTTAVTGAGDKYLPSMEDASFISICSLMSS